MKWILEKSAPQVGIEAEAAAMVNGKPSDYLVAIFDGCETDPEATAASGRPRFRNVPTIAVRCVGEKDFVSTPIAREHQARFPNAWAWYLANAEKQRRHIALSLLPGITPADIAEIEALGIVDAGALADSGVPAELEQWRTLALRLRSLGKPRLRMVDGELREVAA